MNKIGNSFEKLSKTKCIELLPKVGVGRLAICDQGIPRIFPVGYALLGHEVVFMTGEGTKLNAAADNAVVAFEVDRVDIPYHSGWSIVIVGKAQVILDEWHLARARRLVLQPWAPGDRSHYIRIVTEEISGRRIGRSPRNEDW